MTRVTNIAAYQFAELQDLKPLRERLQRRCQELRLKGTILLSPEGINLFVAGERSAVDSLLTDLRVISGLESLSAKFSESDEQPFRRMLVKIKREIIAFGQPGIDPVHRPSPRISPRELKQWLDEGRPVTLLDTRNDYEVQLGTFKHALRLGIGNFRQFPDAVQALPESLKRQPIVMFCTGGIRCEKAGPYMQSVGFEQIHQLDGGILKYFEDCGNAHYEGDCFVFDQRVGLDPVLRESDTSQCFACQSPLTPDDRADERYVEGESCPHCFIPKDQRHAQNLQERHAELARLTQPLPGSVPRENERPLNVPLKYDGWPVLEFLTSILPQISRDAWTDIINQGRLRRRESSETGAADCNTPRDRKAPLRRIALTESVKAGDRLIHVEAMAVEPDVNPSIRILHEDQAIIVVDKPAPLPMHPSGRFHRNTLQYLLSQLYQPQSPRPAHRLDANTSGLVLFTRTRHFASILQQQFERSGAAGIEKRYLARVHGHPAQDVIECHLPISEEPGPLGSRTVDLEAGVAAHSSIRVLERFADDTTLVEVIPHTGRTNQIRIHLWSLEHPICGDPLYQRDGQLGSLQTLSINAEPLCLLAQRLAFNHPLTGQRMVFETELPAWAVASA